MLTWILGVNLKHVAMVIGAFFLVIIILLSYIAFEVKEIHDHDHKDGHK